MKDPCNRTDKDELFTVRMLYSSDRLTSPTRYRYQVAILFGIRITPHVSGTPAARMQFHSEGAGTGAGKGVTKIHYGTRTHIWSSSIILTRKTEDPGRMGWRGQRWRRGVRINRTKD